jgi:hypothetical protein
VNRDSVDDVVLAKQGLGNPETKVVKDIQLKNTPRGQLILHYFYKTKVKERTSLKVQIKHLDQQNYTFCVLPGLAEGDEGEGPEGLGHVDIGDRPEFFEVISEVTFGDRLGHPEFNE